MAWLLALIVLAWARWSGKPFAAFGLVALRSRLTPAIVAGLAFGVFFKIVLKALVMPLMGAPAVNQAYHYLVANPSALPGIILLVLISGAVGEEIVFRGFFFGRMRAFLGSSRATTAVAILVSTVFFAASHYVDQGWPGVEQAVVTGFVFALIFVWRKELWTVMAVHAGFDLAAITMIYAGRENQIAHWLFR